MRYLEDESTYILGNFTTGDTVTITIYKLSDNSKVVDAVACTEISTTGRFKYSFSQAVATKTEYLWIMTNSIEEQQGKIILGGYPDRILTATEVKQFTINDAAATTTKFITTLTETDNTFWPRAALLMTSGQSKGQIRGIKNYNGSTKEIQIQTPLSYAPANGDKAIILHARKFLTTDIVELREEMDANSTKLAFIAAIEGGRWEIISNQMIFYKEDNITEVARFNLLDKDGLPAEKNVMERTRV